VEQMGQLLEQAGMKDVLPLPKARVPVVKFVVGDTNTKVSRRLYMKRCCSTITSFDNNTCLQHLELALLDTVSQSACGYLLALESPFA